MSFAPVIISVAQVRSRKRSMQVNWLLTRSLVKIQHSILLLRHVHSSWLPQSIGMQLPLLSKIRQNQSHKRRIQILTVRKISVKHIRRRRKCRNELHEEVSNLAEAGRVVMTAEVPVVRQEAVVMVVVVRKAEATTVVAHAHKVVVLVEVARKVEDMIARKAVATIVAAVVDMTVHRVVVVTIAVAAAAEVI